MGNSKFCDKCQKVKPVKKYVGNILETGPVVSPEQFVEDKPTELCQECRDELLSVIRPYINFVQKKRPETLHQSYSGR